MSISPRVWCWPGTGPALWVLPSNSSPKFRPTRRKCTSQTEKSTSQFGLKGLFLGTGGTQRCPPRDFFVSHHRGAPPMPNPSPPCKTGRAGVWPIGACSGRNWGLRMRPQSPPGALNTEMWLGAKLFFSSRFTRGARYGKWASCILFVLGLRGPPGPVRAGDRGGMAWFVQRCTVLLCDTGLARGGSGGGRIGKPQRPIPTQCTPIPRPLRLHFPIPWPWASMGGHTIHALCVLVQIWAFLRRPMPTRPLGPGNEDAGHPPCPPRSREATARPSGSGTWGCLGTAVPS